MKWISSFLLLFLTACSAPPLKSTSLHLAFNAPPMTLDPRNSGDFISSTLICLIYEGLTRCVPENKGGGVELALAESYEVSPDGLVYTFHLRKAHWSDGHPITAADFEKSWKWIVDPSFSSPAAYLLFPIKNAEKCAKRQALPDEVAIRALDDRTLRIELERPTPYFLSLTAFPLFLPVPSHSGKCQGEICSGPFQIKQHISNSEILLVKNRNFWNQKETRVEEIRIQIIPDENTALEMFERGEIDWLGGPLAPLPPDSLPTLREKLRFIPMAASTILAFNTQTLPFQNPKLRKALSLAIDRERTISEITVSGQIPAFRPLPPSLFGSSLPPLFGPSDPEKARLLFEEGLAELRVKKADLESMILYYKPAQFDKRLAQVLQQEWKETLGFTIQIEQLDPKSHLDRMHRRDFQIALGAWISQFHDPVNILERYRLSNNQKNFAGWENSHYSDLLEQAGAELDSAKRFELLIQAEEIFAEELPIAPVYHWTSPSLANPRLKEIATTPSGGVLFERFSLTER